MFKYGDGDGGIFIFGQKRKLNRREAGCSELGIIAMNLGEM